MAGRICSAPTTTPSVPDPAQLALGRKTGKPAHDRCNPADPLEVPRRPRHVPALFRPRNQRQPRDHRWRSTANRGSGAAADALFGLGRSRHAARPLRDARRCTCSCSCTGSARRAPPLRRDRAGSDRRLLRRCRAFAAGIRHRRPRRAEADEEAGPACSTAAPRPMARRSMPATTPRWPLPCCAIFGPTPAHGAVLRRSPTTCWRPMPP